MNDNIASIPAVAAPSAERIPPAAAAAGDERMRAAVATASAVLFREILKPLAAGLGPVGETALDRVAGDLFVKRPV